MTQPSTDHPQSRKLGEHLLDELKAVHAYLRHDLAVCQTLAEQVAAGATPEHIRAQIASLQTGSPPWKLRVNCLYYCRVVHTHHSIEDVMMFPVLQQVNPDLVPVVDRLTADHRRVSHLLDEIEASALVVEDGTGIRERIVTALGDLATDLLAHLAFEEEALGPTLLELEEWPY
jgi:iron-sulfur cluster repair protein YtfE (RIC family)